MSGISRPRARKGIASIIGAVFLILIFFSALYTLYVSMTLYDTFMDSKEQELLTAYRVFEAARSLDTTWSDAGTIHDWENYSCYALTVTNHFHEVVGISSFIVQTADSYYYVTQGTFTLGDTSNRIKVNLVRATKYDAHGDEVWSVESSAAFANKFPVWLSSGEKLEVVIAANKSVSVTSVLSSFVEGSGGVGSISYEKS